MRFTLDDIKVADFLGEQESQHVQTTEAFRERLKERRLQGNQHYGDELPWSKTHNLFRLRPGETTLWCGVNGHGKSELLGMVMLFQLYYTRVCIASMEMMPDATIERMIKQASGVGNYSEKYEDKWIRWADEKLWLYDQIDTMPSDRILAMTHYAAKELDCKHVVIDSLMKCGIANDDYNGQKNFLDRLTRAAKFYGIHVHLVHHMRKGEREDKIPDKFDVRGAGEIVDMADNLCIVWRNKRKERMAEAGEEVGGMPDTVLRIGKQRHGEFEGDFLLWHDTASKQFMSKPNARIPWPNPADAPVFLNDDYS